jgi:DNA-binding PadR family transcriptional regulator
MINSIIMTNIIITSITITNATTTGKTMTTKTVRRSSIALAVLAFLYEEPMHPYRMQQLIKERGKDEVINVSQRASLYQTIDRLLRADLIAIREVEREEKWPERTIYELTEEGRKTMLIWMREMLSTPAHEFPEFPAALAYLSLLTPEDARLQLEQRIQTLVAEIARIEAQLSTATEIPRLFLIETDYLRTVLNTELTWVKALVDDLDTGRLTWNEEWLRLIAAQFKNSDGK